MARLGSDRPQPSLDKRFRMPNVARLRRFRSEIALVGSVTLTQNHAVARGSFVIMALKVGINGFGRIGRLVMRAGLKSGNVEFVGINDLVPPDNLAYLLKHDSTHGRFDGTVEAAEDGIVVNGKKVPCFSIKNPAELPWG